MDPIYQSIWICICILPTAATYLPTYPPICQSSVPIYVYVFVYIILWKKVSFSCICGRDWLRDHQQQRWYFATRLAESIWSNSFSELITQKGMDKWPSKANMRITAIVWRVCVCVTCVIQILASLAPEEVKSKQSSPMALLNPYPVNCLTDWFYLIALIDSLI